MTGGCQEQEPRLGLDGADRRPQLAINHTHNLVVDQKRMLNYELNKSKKNDDQDIDNREEFYSTTTTTTTEKNLANPRNITQNCDNNGEKEGEDDEEEEEELLSEALLAVASAEEYAAKIIKLQQACLTPLKEDLADWLNKIMNMSTITTDNFMDKLDNGVIICRLAKIISLWCEQQLAANTNANTNIHSPPINNDDMSPDIENYEPYQNCNRKNSTSVLATPLRQSQCRSTAMFTNGLNAPSRSSSQSTNCLISSSTTSLNNGYTTPGNQFISNLNRMEQTKIWEDAKCRTFYARDNVCNFIRWSKEFGVNQSVLFESDDLVLHANTRQVVLCLLDVARIACVKHGFTEAPGLVKFEQEIDRELAAEKAAALEQQLAQTSTDGYFNNGLNSTPGDKEQQTNEQTLSANRKLSSLARNSRVGSLADATDDLIMRYCLHKEEEAAKKKAAAELEAKLRAEEEEAKLAAEAAYEAAESANLAAKLAAEEAIASAEAAAASEAAAAAEAAASLAENRDEVDQSIDTPNEEGEATLEDEGTLLDNQEDETLPFEADSLTSVQERQTTNNVDDDPSLTKSPVSSESMMQKNNLNYDNRVDSLDSGEGRTESASTSHSRTPSNNNNNSLAKTPNTLKASSIPMPIKRSNSNSSLISNQTSSMGTSELSSSRSSLFSGQDINSAKRHVASDLDGKVMRIAKSYYGKAATKGVTRLSEGKYKIADRIVFVRLLKGHLVMVRIGGGWDTLENFLFRHKSDPSQVIDVDNLLPLETKMSFEKSPQLTPTTSNKFSKLPYYRRSSSASSTNLSTSNLSVSNHSPTSSSTTSTSNHTRTSQQDSLESANHRQTNNINNKQQQQQQIPCLLIHRGHQNNPIASKHNNNNTPHSAFYNQDSTSSSNSSNSSSQPHPSPRSQKSQLRTPNLSRYAVNRPLGSSRTPTASSTNLYPATLTTRMTSTGVKSSMGTTKLNSTTNLHTNGRTSKQEAFRKLGRSNDSLQASYYKSPLHQNHTNGGGGVTPYNNLGAKRKIETHRRSTNGLVRQANSVNA